MKRLKKFILLAPLPLILANCTHYPTPDPYDAKVFSAGKKGVAILRISEHAPKTLNSTNLSLSYRIKRIGNDQAFQVHDTNSIIPGIYNPQDYNNNMMMLDPGVYYIDYLKLKDIPVYGGTILRSYPGPGIKKITSNTANKYLVTIGAFEVKAGQVSYFGHANLPDKAPLPFKVHNEVDQVKKDLKTKGYTNLVEKVSFNQLYQQGSVIIERNGDFSFVDADTLTQKQANLLDKITD